MAAITAKGIAGPELGGVPIEPDELIIALETQTKAAHSGDLSRTEAMLVTQSHILDLLFHNLKQRAVRAEYMSSLMPYMKLAVRAQAQCRANAEALHEIKNPKPVAFVQQANSAHGPQQVNNDGQGGGVSTPVQAGARPRAGGIQKAPNEELQQTHGERLDGGTTQSATASDTHMQTAGTVNGATDASR